MPWPRRGVCRRAGAGIHRSVTYPLPAMALDIINNVPQRLGRDALFGSHSTNGFSSWHKGKVGLDRKSGVTGWVLHDVRTVGFDKNGGYRR